ncbi:DUF6233 domain-containing protein [Streptomyces sp. NPDC058659]|uniref:DUF6233 domain-containing protein n=1 Tax=unclassified Streptomyces TaxID=2593676 RepID=UPI0036516312
MVSAARAPEGHPMLHRGNCGLRAKYGAGELLDVDGAMGAAEEYPDMEMCDVCAPWGSLGIDKSADRPTRPAEVECPRAGPGSRRHRRPRCLRDPRCHHRPRRHHRPQQLKRRHLRA